MSTLRIDEDNLKNGVLTLVVTLVEVIQEALEAQAVRRIEGGSLTEEEQDRLGNALLELDEAMAQLKRDHGINESVEELRRGLDDIVADLVDKVTNPGRWDEGREELG
ncbi:gas vesicle protein K [Sinomonas susongensis]|uniref:gas vesicle protein K n=1 Tax=Sinomonas susongensis TaxID=1324851 RepID=UPI001108FDA8|nr:gas vesicle protein K [Sinomonas susongensis]